MTENKKASILLSITLFIVGFATLVFGNFVVYQIGESTYANGAQASGTLTWTGNSVCGDMVNITDANGVFASFYINVSGHSCPNVPAQAGVFSYVNLTSGSNTSTWTAQNITIAINNNATLAATITATNISAGATLLKHTAGTAGNTVITTETSANAAWGAATLTGGIAITTNANAILNYAGIVMPLFGLLLMIMGFAMLFASVHNFHIVAGGKGGTEGGKSKTSEMYSGNERSSSSGDERG